MTLQADKPISEAVHTDKTLQEIIIENEFLRGLLNEAAQETEQTRKENNKLKQKCREVEKREETLKAKYRRVLLESNKEATNVRSAVLRAELIEAQKALESAYRVVNDLTRLTDAIFSSVTASETTLEALEDSIASIESTLAKTAREGTHD